MRVLASRENKSATSRTSSASTSCSMSRSPRPSMSRALREAKWRIDSLRCAPQTSPPLQRISTSPSFSTEEPQTGQCNGATIGLGLGLTDPGTPLTTFGITSPALRITTSSPIRIPRRATSSMLCSVVLLTVTPPTKTGASRATGVMVPVRPT